MLIRCFFIIIFFFGLLLGLVAQDVIILDEQNEIIPNVVVHSKDLKNVVTTEFDGSFNLSQFAKLDSLYFMHTSYHTKVIAVADLIKINYRIKLEEKKLQLNEVVISVSKFEQNNNVVPNEVLAITAKTISFNNAQTAADVLDQSGEVFVQKSQMGGGSPMLRGFSANSVLLVVDGVRMNNAIYRSGNLQNVITIDPNMLERTEVIFGPGSVIYGSDALGGVMTFYSKSPKLSFSKKASVNSNAFARFASANTEKTIHADFNIGIKKWGFLTGFTYSNFNDLMSGNKRPEKYADFGKRFEYVERINGVDSILSNDNVNLQRFSGYSQINLTQKIKFQPNKNLYMQYGFYYSNSSDIPRYDRLIQTKSNGDLKYAEWYYGPQKWVMNNFQIVSRKATKVFSNYQLTLAHQFVNESRNSRQFQSDDLKNRTEAVSIFSASLDFSKELVDSSKINYGLEWVYNDVQSNAFNRNILTNITTSESTRYPDGGSSYMTSAAYISYQRKLNKNITLLVGVRYNNIYLRSNFIDTTFYKFPFKSVSLRTDAINGSIGLAYIPHKTWLIKMNGSSGFRAPNVDDIGKLFDSEPGNVVVPNPNLKPELAYNMEFSVAKTIEDKLIVKGVFFYTYLSDAIVRRDFLFNGQDSIIYDGVLSNVQALVNTGEAFIFGTSFQIKYFLNKNILFSSSITYTEGRDLIGDIPLRHIPPLFGDCNITYQKKKLKAMLYLRYNGNKPFDDLAPVDQNKAYLYTIDGTPAWYTFNIKTAYDISKKIKLSLGIENILNKNYRPFSSGISAAGRNFIVALRGSF